MGLDAGINALAVALAAIESARTGQRQLVAEWLGAGAAVPLHRRIMEE